MDGKSREICWIIRQFGWDKLVVTAKLLGSFGPFYKSSHHNDGKSDLGKNVFICVQVKKYLFEYLTYSDLLQ